MISVFDDILSEWLLVKLMACVLFIICNNILNKNTVICVSSLLRRHVIQSFTGLKIHRKQ